MPDGREQNMNKGSPVLTVVDDDPRMLESLEDIPELLSVSGLMCWNITDVRP
jgi:hypothetical protein